MPFIPNRVFRLGAVKSIISILSLQTDELSIEEIKAILAANNCPHVVHDEVTHGNKQKSCVLNIDFGHFALSLVKF